MTKDHFKYCLSRYVNTGCLSAADKFICILFPKYIFRKNAVVIRKDFQKLKTEKIKSSQEVVIKVKPYDGRNQHVKELAGYLENNLKDSLSGAYVHGSLGTNEEIGYSDMDTLVILKDEMFAETESLADCARQVSLARKFMMKLDPLQHHGWFVMTESDLHDYSETYFPSELFRHSKSLLKSKGSQLNLNICENEDLHVPFKTLCNSIEKKLNHQQVPRNAYELKNFLSEFMLLPALYVQARDKKGIYKKFSFGEARKDFPVNEWQIMDEVSLIRQNWNVNYTPLEKKLVAAPRFFSVNLAKWLSPPIPAGLRKKLTPEFYISMRKFAKMICEKI